MLSNGCMRRQEVYVGCSHTKMKGKCEEGSYLLRESIAVAIVKIKDVRLLASSRNVRHISSTKKLASEEHPLVGLLQALTR